MTYNNKYKKRRRRKNNGQKEGRCKRVGYRKTVSERDRDRDQSKEVKSKIVRKSVRNRWWEKERDKSDKRDNQVERVLIANTAGITFYENRMMKHSVTLLQPCYLYQMVD